jgi:hypothetical protein
MKISRQLKRDALGFGFGYNRPNMQPIRFNKYEGKSLPEIEAEFGIQAAYDVYTLAANGYVDLTKSIVDDEPQSYDTIVDVDIDYVWFGEQVTINITLIANQYTQASDNKHIDYITTNAQGIRDSIIPYIVEQAIRNKFGSQML